MSYYPKKGMYRDENGVNRFVSPGEGSAGPVGKRWWLAEVVRRAFNGKDEVIRKNRQETAVFAREEDVVGLAMRRCPDPWPGQDASRTQTNAYFRPLGEDEGV